jgi:hypothetical protein
VRGQSAIAFTAPKGGGKSTLAAYCLRRGARLLADDALPLRIEPSGVYGLPSLPYMKLWPETATETLGIADDLPDLLPNYDKKLMAVPGRYRYSDEPARVRTIYLLERSAASARGDGVSIRRLSGREAVLSLVRQLAGISFLEPGQHAQFLPTLVALVRQAPVHLLTYPDDVNLLDEVYERVTEHAASVSHEVGESTSRPTCPTVEMS